MACKRGISQRKYSAYKTTTSPLADIYSNIINMMLESLESKKNNYKLLSFGHEEVIINDLGQNLEGVLQFHQRSVFLDWSYTSLGPGTESTQKGRDIVSND